MRSERGITFMSLVIYLIGMTMVIAIISRLTTFFYKNVNIADVKSDSLGQYSNFSSPFTHDVNSFPTSYRENDALKINSASESGDNQVLDIALIIEKNDGSSPIQYKGTSLICSNKTDPTGVTQKDKVNSLINNTLNNISAYKSIEAYIVFSSGNQYTFKNNAIYKNKTKICDNIEFCAFTLEVDTDKDDTDIKVKDGIRENKVDNVIISTDYFINKINVYFKTKDANVTDVNVSGMDRTGDSAIKYSIHQIYNI